MKIGSNSLSEIDRKSIAHAIMIASNAERELGSKAGDGAKARPTVGQLNRTLERLCSIQTVLEPILAEHAEERPDLATLRQAIIDNTTGDLFWIGEILLGVLEQETGFKGEVRQ